MMTEVGRPETVAKKNKKLKAGLRNINSCLFKKPLLPTPDFGLPSLTTMVSIKITAEPFQQSVLLQDFIGYGAFLGLKILLIGTSTCPAEHVEEQEYFKIKEHSPTKQKKSKGDP